MLNSTRFHPRASGENSEFSEEENPSRNQRTLPGVTFAERPVTLMPNASDPEVKAA